MVKKAMEALERTAVGRRAIRDGQFRTVLLACWSLCLNLAYAVFNGVLGVLHDSYWYVTLFAYYAVLSAMRYYTVTYEFRKKSGRTVQSVMRFCGGWLCFLSVVVSGIVVLTIHSQRDSSRSVVVMIAIAAYTFWKATMAVINIVKARKQKNLLLITLRNINCADAAMSMLSLEHAMISTFEGSYDSFSMAMDAATGAGAFAIVFALGISMVIQGSRKQT